MSTVTPNHAALACRPKSTRAAVPAASFTINTFNTWHSNAHKTMIPVGLHESSHNMTHTHDCLRIHTYITTGSTVVSTLIAWMNHTHTQICADNRVHLTGMKVHGYESSQVWKRPGMKRPDIILIYLLNKSMEYSDFWNTYKSIDFLLCGILFDSYFW